MTIMQTGRGGVVDDLLATNTQQKLTKIAIIP